MKRFLPLIATTVSVAIALSSCGDATLTTTTTTGPSAPSSSDAYTARIDALSETVAVWRSATTIADAHAAAEAAANLVVGPNGPDYGDRDGDGSVGGPSTEGLLPGLDGSPGGLALPLSDNACIEADVLGGPWDDPRERWDAMAEAIDAWTPVSNTMPTLPSHPMRVVGWATFTLASGSLDDAHEYAGHAALHVTVSERALDC